MACCLVDLVTVLSRKSFIVHSSIVSIQTLTPPAHQPCLTIGREDRIGRCFLLLEKSASRLNLFDQRQSTNQVSFQDPQASPKLYFVRKSKRHERRHPASLGTCILHPQPSRPRDTIASQRRAARGIEKAERHSPPTKSIESLYGGEQDCRRRSCAY